MNKSWVFDPIKTNSIGKFEEKLKTKNWSRLRGRAVHEKSRPNPLAKTVRFGPSTSQPDAGDLSTVGLSLLNLKTAGQLAGLRLRNQFSTGSIVSDQQVSNFLSNLLRLGLIRVRTRRDSACSLPDMPRSHQDLTRYRWDRPNLFEIRRDLIKIWSNLARSDSFW